MLAPNFAASVRAIADLPAAVGPQMTRTLSPAEAPLNFLPGEMHDNRSAVDVVRGELRPGECHKKRAHLGLAELIASFDCRFARDSCRKALVLCATAGAAISSQCRQCVAQTTLGIEARMRHWHRSDQECVSSKSLGLKTELLENRPVLLKRFRFGWTQMQRERKEKTLPRRITALQRAHEFLEENTLVSGMLIDEHHPIITFE